MKDIRSLLLVLLSFGLVATWVYHLYDKAAYSQQRTEAYVRDSVATANGIRDSLQKVYTASMVSLDTQLDSTRSRSDSLREQLTLKVKEINRLRTEIADILKNPRSTSNELSVAKSKMKEMEMLVGELKEEKSTLESEKLQLNTRLSELSGEVDDLQKNIRRLDDENRRLTDKIKMASVFVASALHFTAIDVKENKEQETSLARKANKFVVSFIVQNNFNDYMNAELVISVIKPDGSILQSSVWDSGSFDTRSEGRKQFTRKIRLDYLKGEQKALVFSLDTDSPQKGTYLLQIWHDGTKIGETTKTLS